LPANIEGGLQRIADAVYMLIPRSRPSQQALGGCKIISHRGEHDNRRIRENTMAAFEPVHEAGVWGIELDVRWTKDLHPVVIHDADTRRVFNVDMVIAEVTLDELLRRVPEIPTLTQVVERFGGRIHLMVELKYIVTSNKELHSRRLQHIFSSLSAGDDYHFIALHTELFDFVGFAGESAFLPVAEFNVQQFSRIALERKLAGISGQYLLLSNKMIQRHHLRKQKIGAGFPASRFSFYRELNRGVDWIFTNHALKLRSIQQELFRNR